MNKFLNKAIWYYHREKWVKNAIVESTKTKKLLNEYKFNSPIFMVGLQGAGETLLGRIIRKSPEVVSVSGNYNFWFGPDEMHTVLGPILDRRLTGQLHKVPRRDLYGRRRGWAYASDSLLHYYKLDKEEVDIKLRKNLIYALRVIERFGIKGSSRIFDKSQSYALKIPAIREILKESNPKFIAVVRNPFASVYRASFKTTHLSREKISNETRVKVAATHWNNTITRILDAEEEKSNDLLIVKIEDCLESWPELIPIILKHVNLDYNPSFLPSQYDIIPTWAKRRERWYPVKKEVNKRYFDEIPKWVSDKVYEICGKNAKTLGYV